MNTKFMKALYQLNQGKYEEAESNIKSALSETTNIYELLEINSCYAELLYELERYEEAMKCVNYILNNCEEFEGSTAYETALEIKSNIEEQ